MYVVIVRNPFEKFHIKRLIKAGHTYNKEVARQFAREWSKLIGFKYEVVKI